MNVDNETQDSSHILTKQLTILNQKGLHARASALFVKNAEKFNAKIMVNLAKETVPATSIMGLLLLGAHQGSVIELIASGPEAFEALEALAHLVNSRFHEE